jgi:microcystin degradation protein MlrC
MQHETNTFSTVPTPLARFSRGNAKPVPLEGQAAIDAFRNTGTALGAFIELAEAEDLEMVVPMAASAWPSGPVEDAAYAYMTDRICAAVEQGCDAILLHLHGAMVTESLEDGEGALLARVRALAPNTPIGVALDMHTNLYPAIVDSADVVAGYQTYPHIDVYETGIRAAKPILAMLKGKAEPTMAWGNRPMLPHVMRQGTDDFPNSAIQALCAKMEADGALCATFFTGFPHADIELAGSSAVVVTDGDQAKADALCREILDLAWKHRAEFVYEIEPLDESLARAKTMTEGPIVLLDHYDNAASGGSMDSMTVLKAILEAGLDNVAAFAVCDPDAVTTMAKAGRDGDPDAGRQDRHAVDRPHGRAADGHRPGPADLRRPVPQHRADEPRRAERHGADRGARHRQGRDRCGVDPAGAERLRLLPEPRHRPDRQTLPDAEEPGALARRLQADRPADRRLCRGRGVHLRLFHARLQERPPSDLPAGRGPAADVHGIAIA